MRFLFLLATTAVLFTLSSLAQGTVIFNNRTPTGDAPFSLGTGRGAGAVRDTHAQLFLVGAGGVLTPLFPTTTFRTNSESAMYFVKEINPFVVDGVAPGQPATFRVRVYQGESYEAAVQKGLFHLQSLDVTVPQLGGTLPDGRPIPTPSLNGLVGSSRLDRWPPPSYVLFRSISMERDQLHFTVDNNSDQLSLLPVNYVLQASPDLFDWQPLLTNPPASFTIPYNPAIDRNRFFRPRPR